MISPNTINVKKCKCNLFNVNNMQSPEPVVHEKVLDNNPDRIGIWKCWFF